jgi:hypothetical protein
MRPFRPAAALRHLTLAATPALLAACSDGDANGDGARGAVAFTTYGEDYIEQRIPPEDVADGWAIAYEKFLVVFRDIKVAAAGGELGAEMASSVLVDLKRPGDKPLASFDLPARTWDAVSYQLGPVDAATALGPGVTEADRALMNTPTATVYAAGSATKGGATKTFKWLFNKPTLLAACEGDKDGRLVLGAAVTSGNVDQIQLTVHGDHLFYDDLQSPEARVRFDPIAGADANGDGEVTLAELRAVKLSDLTAGPYGTGSADVNDLGAFVEALSQTVGHFRGEGECKARSL